MITVRPAVVGDGPVLAWVDLATWTAQVSPTPAPEDRASYAFFDERIEPRDVIVAEIDGRVCGFVALRASTPLAARAHVLEIGGLAVDPHHQRKGIGRLLVDQAVQECASRGARKVVLRVLGSNAAARRLYEGCGFAVEGVLAAEFLLDGSYVDDIRMARHLVQPGS